MTELSPKARQHRQLHSERHQALQQHLLPQPQHLLDRHTEKTTRALNKTSRTLSSNNWSLWVFHDCRLTFIPIR